MKSNTRTISTQQVSRLYAAAQDRGRVAGYTHGFYRYPARFSPTFAAAAIECYSDHGDLVVDPYMGGGTTVVEALALGRRVVGNDLNSLAAFIAKVKTTPLTRGETAAAMQWAQDIVPALSYRASGRSLDKIMLSAKTKNLSIVRARFIKKAVAGAINSLDQLPSPNSQNFIRCALLRVGQWALDGRATHTTVSAFRDRLQQEICGMLDSLDCWTQAARSHGRISRVISNRDATDLPSLNIFCQRKERASLIVTSPPYPCIHILYHRWQVDGRRETPAPYWIANCNDGQGASFYNFGGRQDPEATAYFERSLKTLCAIRQVIADGGHMVQLVAFAEPLVQLKRYLANMEAAGFAEITPLGLRSWREVPSRRWHAALRGKTAGSNEVILIHRAV